jgi:cytochrome c oxidase subunit IV
MTEAEQRLGVILLLFLQALLAILSFNGVWAISIFCTATRDPALDAFGWIHFVYAGLFLSGLLAIMWRRLRLPYAIVLALSLLALPVQYWLVHDERLYCDAF